MIMDCPKCGHDEAVTYLTAPDGGHLYTCHYTHEGQDNWQWLVDPKKPDAPAVGWAPTGVTADLVAPLENIMRSLPHMWLEHGVIEYELRLQYPAVFGKHVAERGHRLTTAGQVTASGTRFAAGLLRLERLDIVIHRTGTATGGWDYNGEVGYWALRPAPAVEDTMTWVQRCAELGRDPGWGSADYAEVQELAASNGG